MKKRTKEDFPYSFPIQIDEKLDTRLTKYMEKSGRMKKNAFKVLIKKGLEVEGF